MSCVGFPEDIEVGLLVLGELRKELLQEPLNQRRPQAALSLNSKWGG